MTRKQTKRRQLSSTYSLIQILMASPTQPTPAAKVNHELMFMYQGLWAIESGSVPTKGHWRACSDAVNLLETLVTSGIATDDSGLLQDAITALAMAGKRHMTGKPMRLDGPGIAAVRAVLEDYAACLWELPERTMVQCHRDTEVRIRGIFAGKRQAHDVEMVSL